MHGHVEGGGQVVWRWWEVGEVADEVEGWVDVFDCSSPILSSAFIILNENVLDIRLILMRDLISRRQGEGIRTLLQLLHKPRLINPNPATTIIRSSPSHPLILRQLQQLDLISMLDTNLPSILSSQQGSNNGRLDPPQRMAGHIVGYCE